MPIQDPFHEGELAVQERAGEESAAQLNAGMIASAIMPGALPFIARLPWVVLGGADAEGRLWCSALLGEPGFMTATPDGTEVHFDLRRAPAHPSNPLLVLQPVGRWTGALFIEPATRRRLRVNGRIQAASAERLHLTVEEAFPNCPKFIHPRPLDGLRSQPSGPAEAGRGERFGEAELRRITAADTMFLATLHPGRGADASHRGGPPGFMEVVDGTTLRWPDYPGNGLFNSFGNLAVDSRMGLLIPDFDSGTLLHLSGTARVVWDAPDPEDRTAGTNRFIEFQLQHWVVTPSAAALDGNHPRGGEAPGLRAAPGGAGRRSTPAGRRKGGRRPNASLVLRLQHFPTNSKPRHEPQSSAPREHV